MAKKNMLEEIAGEAQNRRSLMRKLALGSAAGAALLTAPGKLKADDDDDYDVSILNFALNLEYLEAEFYSVATTGSTIDKFKIGIDGLGAPGPTTGGSIIRDFHNASQLGRLSDIALQLASDERAHVALLRSYIEDYYSAVPIAKPAINLGALGIGFGSAGEFLTVGRILEDVGVSAYNYATSFVNSFDTFFLLSKILGTESQHVGNLRTQIAGLNLRTQAVDCLDVPPPPTGKYFSTYEIGLTVYRDPPQVLYLAYGNQKNAFSGGFFPAGINGEFTGPSSNGQDCYGFIPDVASYVRSKAAQVRTAAHVRQSARPAARANFKHLSVKR